MIDWDSTQFLLVPPLPVVVYRRLVNQIGPAAPFPPGTKRPQEASPEAAWIDEMPIYQSTSLWWLSRARLAIPKAALLFASFLGLLLFTVFLGESRNSERKADGQGENGNNGFHGAFPLRMGGNHKVCPRRLRAD